MNSIFSIDSPIVQKLSFVFDFMMVNMIYILCCMPIVTIGAARAALFTVGNAWAVKDDAGAMAFLKAFFKNLKTATPVWLVMLAVGAFLVWDIFLLVNNQVPLELVLWVVLIVCCFCYVVVASQLFQMVAHYNCTVKQYLKNSLLVGIAHPICLVVNTLLAILPYFTLFYNFSAFLQLTLIWILAIFSIQGFISGAMSKKFYQRLTDQFNGVTPEERAAMETPVEE